MLINRKTVVICRASQQGPHFRQPIPMRLQLEHKIAFLRAKIATIEESPVSYSHFLQHETEELYQTLAKVKVELVKHNMDPLSTEICIDEPWLQECKVFDF